VLTVKPPTLASTRFPPGNETSAIATLLARYEGPVYRFGLRFCRDPEDARDVLQETLLAAARGFPSYRGQAALGRWLYTIARSFCIKQRRRRIRAASLSPGASADDEAREVPDPAAAPDEAAISRELGGAVRRAIAELGRPYREVLVLRDVEGLTAPEVAAALGIGVDAVKSRLHRAREKLAPLVGTVEPPVHGCPDVLALFSRRLEGQVDAHLCEEMERHLTGCPRCATACDGLKRTLSLCVATRGATVPPQVQASVRRAVQELLRAEG
jgi:RNA polymerase sigma-70 factor, ECF subfamily